MYTKMQAYRELGDFIDHLYSLEQNINVLESIDVLTVARDRMSRTSEFRAALHRKRAGDILVPVRIPKPVVQQPVYEEPTPQHKGHSSHLMPLVAAALIFREMPEQ